MILTDEQRSKLSDEDFGDPHNRLYPILDNEDVQNAVRVIGKSVEHEEVKNRIKQIIGKKGLKLPDAWNDYRSDSLMNFSKNQPIRRVGKFFEVGKYPTHNFELTEQEADEAFRNQKPANLNIGHKRTVLDGMVGTIGKWYRKGKELIGEFHVPEWLNDLYKDKPIPISAEWDRETKQLVGCALEVDPAIVDAAIGLTTSFTNTTYIETEEDKVFFSQPFQIAVLEEQSGEPKKMKLGEILNSLFTKHPELANQEVDAPTTTNPPANTNNGGGVDMNAFFTRLDTQLAKEREDAKTAREAMQADFAKQIEELKTTVQTQNEALAKEKESNEANTLFRRIDTLFAREMITPARRDQLKLSVADKDGKMLPVNFSAVSLACDIAEESGKHAAFSIRGLIDSETIVNRETIDGGNPYAQLVGFAKEIETKEGLSAPAAFAKACQQHSDLALKYREQEENKAGKA